MDVLPSRPSCATKSHGCENGGMPYWLAAELCWYGEEEAELVAEGFEQFIFDQHWPNGSEVGVFIAFTLLAGMERFCNDKQMER